MKEFNNLYEIGVGKETKKNKKFCIRHPTGQDAQRLIEYSKLLLASTDQLLTTLEEYIITEEAERTWINNFNQNHDSLLLIAEMDMLIVGLLFFVPLTKKKNSHSGEFGVNVHPDWQGNGIGQALIEELLKWARANIKIEKVFLTVFHTNQRAIQLYNKLGFAVEGRHVKAIKQSNGEYLDIIQMYIMV